jgi:hypothetical protein
MLFAEYRRKGRDCPGLRRRRGDSSPKWRELGFPPLECGRIFSMSRLLFVYWLGLGESARTKNIWGISALLIRINL